MLGTFLRRGLTALAALAALSCGTLGYEELGHLPTDGTSGYRDAEPLELCIGPVPVGPARGTSGELALCVEAERAAEACNTDGDCGYPERCRCGRCAVRACDANSNNCLDNEICASKRCVRQCQSDAECPSGAFCSVGGCVRRCGADGACGYGERCDVKNDTCIAAACTGGVRCRSDQRCEPFERIATVSEPAALAGTPWRFVAVKPPGAASAIYRVRETSPVLWVADPSAPVLEAVGGAAAPTVIKGPGGVDLYFASEDGAALSVAASADGAAFASAPTRVLRAADVSWAPGGIASPSAADFGGRRLLFFQDAAGTGIGAVELRGDLAVPVADRPLLRREDVEDPHFWRGVTWLGNPEALVSGEALRLYFAARGADALDATQKDGTFLRALANESIGLATTVDLTAFDLFPTGPVFGRRASLTATLGEREPMIVLDGETPRLVFHAFDATGRGDTGLAVATAP